MPERQNPTEANRFAQWLRNHGRLVVLALALSATAGAVTMEEGIRKDSSEAIFWGSVIVATSTVLSSPFLADEIEVAFEKLQSNNL